MKKTSLLAISALLVAISGAPASAGGALAIGGDGGGSFVNAPNSANMYIQNFGGNGGNADAFNSRPSHDPFSGAAAFGGFGGPAAVNAPNGWNSVIVNFGGNGGNAWATNVTSWPSPYYGGKG